MAEKDDKEAVVEALAEPGEEEQLGEEEAVGRDGEQVGGEGAEGKGFECEGQVVGCGSRGDVPREAEQIDGPHIVVFQGAPEEAGGDSLSGSIS